MALQNLELFHTKMHNGLKGHIEKTISTTSVSHDLIRKKIVNLDLPYVTATNLVAKHNL